MAIEPTPWSFKQRMLALYGFPVVLAVVTFIPTALWAAYGPQPPSEHKGPKTLEGNFAMAVRAAIDDYAEDHGKRYPEPSRAAAELDHYVDVLWENPYLKDWKVGDLVTIPWAERNAKLGRGHAYDGKALDRRTYGAIVYSCSPDRTQVDLFGVIEVDGEAFPVRDAGF